MKSRKQKAIELCECILLKSAELFSRRGFDRVSMREVADACDVSKPAIYYHFENKEALGKAIIEDFYSMLFVELGKALQIDTPEPHQFIENVVTNFMTACSERTPCALFVVQQYFSGTETALLKHIMKLEEKVDCLLQGKFLEYEQEGLIVPGSSRSLIMQLSGNILVLITSLSGGLIDSYPKDFYKMIASDIFFGFSTGVRKRSDFSELSNLHTKLDYIFENCKNETNKGLAETKREPDHA